MTFTDGKTSFLETSMMLHAAHVRIATHICHSDAITRSWFSQPFLDLRRAKSKRGENISGGTGYH